MLIGEVRMGVFGSFSIQAWLAKSSQANLSLSLASQDMFV
jgi:hypothetical protein